MDEDLGTVIGLTSGPNNQARLTVLHHQVRFHIDISIANLENPPRVLRQYLELLSTGESSYLSEPHEFTADNFFDCILQGCSSELTCLAMQEDHSKASTASTASLEDYIHAKTYHLTLHINQSGDFILLQRDDELDVSRLGTRFPKNVHYTWPVFGPSEISICADSYEQALSQIPGKVTQGGSRLLFFKPYRFCDSRLAKRELEAYRKMQLADLRDLKITRLEGLVKDQQGTLFGLLLSYIDGQPLTDALTPSTADQLRQQWAEKIASTVTGLHNAGIVWGDAKPDNILIDKKNNPWVIDFGGGYTEGWVDQDIAGTREGDRQGLARIIHFVLTIPSPCSSEYDI
jgi:hypothetical protein